MIAPIDKIKKLLNDDIVTLFGEDIINKSFVDAYRVVNNLITDENVLEALFTQDLDDNKFSTTYEGTSDSDILCDICLDPSPCHSQGNDKIMCDGCIAISKSIQQ